MSGRRFILGQYHAAHHEALRRGWGEQAWGLVSALHAVERAAVGPGDRFLVLGNVPNELVETMEAAGAERIPASRATEQRKAKHERARERRRAGDPISGPSRSAAEG